MAGAQCFLPDKPTSPCGALAGPPSRLPLRALPREGLAEEENHFSRLAAQAAPSSRPATAATGNGRALHAQRAGGGALSSGLRLLPVSGPHLPSPPGAEALSLQGPLYSGM